MNRKQQIKAIMARIKPTVQKGRTWQSYQADLTLGVNEKQRMARERQAKILDQQVQAEIDALTAIQALDQPSNISAGAW